MPLTKTIVAAATAIALVLIGNTTAGAATNLDGAVDAVEDEQIAVFTRDASGALVALEDVVSSTSLSVEEPNTTDPDVVSPYLIDFNQWFSCFSLNNKDDVFAFYTFYRDGSGHDVRLKCGEQNDVTGNGWGYKHIRAGKEVSWQDKFNIAISKGWIPESQGMEGWDDLMHAGAGSAITYWNYASGIKGNNTRCVVGELVFAKATTGGNWEIVYEFNVVAVFAWGNSDRLITAYPTGSSTC